MPPKILVIDDERPTLSMFKLFLDAYGFDVYTAENGDEGIALFQKHTMPIVLTDIKMPGMDGLEVLKRIKGIAPKTEVIIITGHGDMDLAIKALSLDATDFINKPIQQKDLDLALKRAQERIQLSWSMNSGYGIRTLDNIGIIDISGSINSGTEVRLRDAFSAALTESRKLVLSFSENTSINGAGIAILTQLLLDCRAKSIPVALAGLSDNFNNILGMVGINKLAEICDTEETALKSI